MGELNFIGFCYVLILSIHANYGRTTGVIVHDGSTLNTDNCTNYVEWQCKRGEYIEYDKHCNGQMDCVDGSDETFEECFHYICPKYAYQCAYGACVHGEAKCDLVKDCADNSDEISCSKTYPVFVNASNIQSTKAVTYEDDDTLFWRCKSNEFINEFRYCDGKIDCNDGSDESLEVCYLTECPKYAFRCAYGACVNGDAKCDGAIDCADGSDETPNLCQKLIPGTSQCRDPTECRQFQWKCKNGQCIDSDERCDGVVECSDGSDETAEACFFTRCPNFSYRCAYGACVNVDAACNGVKDCADNSDESPLICAKIINGSADQDTFTCASGQVISVDSACDGKQDCIDGSDETLRNCASIRCPLFAYRCAYGACVNIDVKCNGIVDCADGSDEDLSLCGPTYTTMPPDA